MRDTMLKIPGNPSHPDEGDLYENIDTRPGTTEKQKEAMMDWPNTQTQRAKDAVGSGQDGYVWRY